jgi:hypothetical protein
MERLTTIETARMRGTVPDDGDLPFLRGLLADPRVGETMGGVRNPD